MLISPEAPWWQNNLPLTPLDQAARDGDIDCLLSILRKLPADRDTTLENDVNYVDYQTGHTPIFSAIKKGSPECVRALIKYGADPKFLGTNLSESTLHCLARLDNPSIKILNILMERGVDINGKTIHDHTPLFDAVFHNQFKITGNLQFIKSLVAEGADITINPKPNFFDGQKTVIKAAESSPANGKLMQILTKTPTDFVSRLAREDKETKIER